MFRSQAMESSATNMEASRLQAFSMSATARRLSSELFPAFSIGWTNIGVTGRPGWSSHSRSTEFVATGINRTPDVGSVDVIWRSEERRVGKGGVSPCRSRGLLDNEKKKKQT